MQPSHAVKYYYYYYYMFLESSLHGMQTHLSSNASLYHATRSSHFDHGTSS